LKHQTESLPYGLVALEAFTPCNFLCASICFAQRSDAGR